MLEDTRLKQCTGDEECYYDGVSIIGTHVDDILAIGPPERLDEIENALEMEIELDKRGKPDKMLGVELNWEEEKVTLTQKALIEKMAKEYNVNGIQQSLPLNKDSFTKFDTGDKEYNQTKFQQIICLLLYIDRTTRPEISIQVNLLGRCIAKPSCYHMRAAVDTL